MRDFGPYFTDRYKTPWGPALNFDGPYSDEVSNYFIQNALYWIVDCHIDALRLDAVHAILDHSPITFLEELTAEVHRMRQIGSNREIFLIAESADNDRPPHARARIAAATAWTPSGTTIFIIACARFSPASAAVITEDYGDFTQLVKAYREGFAYSGEYSRFRRRRHGSSSRDLARRSFCRVRAESRPGRQSHARRSVERRRCPSRS